MGLALSFTHCPRDTAVQALCSCQAQREGEDFNGMPPGNHIKWCSKELINKFGRQLSYPPPVPLSWGQTVACGSQPEHAFPPSWGRPSRAAAGFCHISWARCDRSRPLGKWLPSWEAVRTFPGCSELPSPCTPPCLTHGCSNTPLLSPPPSASNAQGLLLSPGPQVPA